MQTIRACGLRRLNSAHCFIVSVVPPPKRP
jgi:hypothetical protein